MRAISRGFKLFFVIIILLACVAMLIEYAKLLSPSTLLKEDADISQRSHSRRANRFAKPKVAQKTQYTRETPQTKQTLNGYHNFSELLKHPELVESSDRIAVLVMVCNRSEALASHLDKLISSRQSAALFPIIVSQDCREEEIGAVVETYGAEIEHHIMQPDQSPPVVAPEHEVYSSGYYRIARHYRWALDQVFKTFNYSTVIVTEDDLDIAPDFLEYFGATRRLLEEDPSLWCVSAWNDHGKANLIDARRNDLLYRTDFFSGLGWMLTSRLWAELGPKWPAAFWDDWLREPGQRRDRACIRPEISRTAMSGHGKKGVSKGTFYDEHLKHIQLNKDYFEFSQTNLDYLLQANYDHVFITAVYGKALLVNDPSLLFAQPKEYRHKYRKFRSLRMQYSSPETYVDQAELLGFLDDFKAGVPRMAYKGVVPLFINGWRLYLTPPLSWAGYNKTW